ncbi:MULTISPECIES: hypothetical protein [Mycetohabitans]|uniref:hypothetical protein n=1 Tax=Mycetohabitans TaxID=2571159 RepID=UPI0012FF24CC|nr:MULTISPECIES: hypothetical protein [Mycetohabitans]MCG1048520.1 hypothetical protein [Mycetohabitans sp. B6]
MSARLLTLACVLTDGSICVVDELYRELDLLQRCIQSIVPGVLWPRAGATE